MSLNNTLNAVIALIENKPDIARAYFRDPKSDIKNIGEATARLYTALDNRTVHELRLLLVKVLAVQPNSELLSEDPIEIDLYDDGFYNGVRAVEEIIEDYINKLV